MLPTSTSFANRWRCTLAALYVTAPLLAAASPTSVSLEFDDSFADQYQVKAMLKARGMRATFYVNSGRIGMANYMSQGEILALQLDGNEIAGHTVSHADLPTRDLEEQRRQ